MSSTTPSKTSTAASAAAAGASPHWEERTWQNCPPGSMFDNLGPCLALQAHLALDLDGKKKASGTGKTALVPGCGRGHDVHLLASHGYRVVGLDLAPSATEAAKEWAMTLDCPQEQKERVE